jgi:hypothetical protein
MVPLASEASSSLDAPDNMSSFINIPIRLEKTSYKYRLKKKKKYNNSVHAITLTSRNGVSPTFNMANRR